MYVINNVRLASKACKNILCFEASTEKFVVQAFSKVDPTCQPISVLFGREGL